MEQRWEINYSESSLIDLDEIRKYIYRISKSEKISLDQINKIMKEIDQLDHFPLRYQIYPQEPLHSEKIRYLVVNNLFT